ncbi:hypothetical protein FOT75_27275, partial [Klebsiella michiganensis]|nr:hypothetical protein [Klebsiella michiganensis]
YFAGLRWSAEASPGTGRVTASAASQSPPHRHILRRARTQVRAFFCLLHLDRGRPRPSCVIKRRDVFPGILPSPATF